MSDIDRKRAIEILKTKTLRPILFNNSAESSQEIIDFYEALNMAISSLETDEAYQLEYEKPTTTNDLAHNLCDSCINYGCEFQSGIVRTKCAFYMPPQDSTTKNDLGVSSGLENASPFIDWNNCHTSEQLDSISTTKNDLGVDAVSRQAINGYIDYILSHGMGKKKSFDFIKKFVANLPSVTPIRPKGHWIDHSDDGYVECPKCGSATNCDDNINDLHFCFSCGAELRGSTKRKGNPIEGNNESYNCENWIP